LLERTDSVGRKQAALVIVEQHLRLDRRIVPDGDRAIGLPLAQRLGRFDDRQRAAGAVVGDAGIGCP
jgi:hypothetical protein